MASIKALDDKDKDALNVPYKFDLSGYLGAGQTISSIVSITSNDGNLTVSNNSITDSSKSITTHLSGGTANQYSTVTARYTLSGSPVTTDERSFRVYIRDL